MNTISVAGQKMSEMLSTVVPIFMAIALLSGQSMARATTELLPAAQVQTIDLTTPTRLVAPTPIEGGTAVNPQGNTITCDNYSFFMDGKPWVPVVGEMHFTRYPETEWRQELLKMKAGGLDTVATYVFWIHHEEVQGKFDWTGRRSLRTFLGLCQETGLKAIVRLGPWAHGEVRNGGFPDWLGMDRSNPNYLKIARLFMREEAAQMKGLLWKDGGPVIAVQLDNELNWPDHLLALKKIAREEGIDVPLYTMTGWNGVQIPKAGLLPLFGAYSDGFWGGSLEEYRSFFFFTDIRDNGDMGAQTQNVNSWRNKQFSEFPFACCEIGGGMMSSYYRRIKIVPELIAAMAMTRLGCGNNMPGYYMYHGGTNPKPGLHEHTPNLMPVMDYDFQAPLGACGQVRKHYSLLRMQHLFLQNFGETFARMPAFFPDRKPADKKDFDTLRWGVRADGQGNGFIFFSNLQPYIPLPEHKDIRFEMKTASGSLQVPKQAIAIPSGAYGIWPLNLNMQGAVLEYATVQPLCHVGGEDGVEVYFFTELPGIRAELKFQGEAPLLVTPGSGVAAARNTPTGKKISVVVLTKEQGEALYLLPFAGRERVILSDCALFADKTDLKQLAGPTGALSIYPPLGSVQVGGDRLSGKKDGVFACFDLPKSAPVSARVTAVLKKPAKPLPGPNKGYEEAIWTNAAEYTLDIPKSVTDRHAVLDIHFQGDAARIYAGENFILDHFPNGTANGTTIGTTNGDPLSIALWRISKDDLKSLRLLVLPHHSKIPVPDAEAPVVSVLDMETKTISSK